MSQNVACSTFIVLLFFLVHPISGILISLFFDIYLYSKNVSKYNGLLTVFVLSFFLGLINMTKYIESDMENYLIQFDLAKESGFFSYLLLVGKEFAFYSYMYFLSSCIKLDFASFTLINTFISYFCLLYSVVLIYKKLSLKVVDVVVALVSISFFFELFSLSAHLMRQFLAMSVLLLGLVYFILYNRKMHLLILCAGFIHSSAFLFLPLLFFPPIRKPFSVKSIILTFFAVFILAYAVVLLAGNLEFVYIFQRIGANDFNSESHLEIVTIVFTLLFLISILLLMKRYIMLPRSAFWFNVFMFLPVFILGFSFIQETLSYRYGFYVYAYFFVFFPILINRKGVGFLSVFMRSVWVVLLLFRFGYKLENGTFEFDSLNNIMFNTCFYFF